MGKNVAIFLMSFVHGLQVILALFCAGSLMAVLPEAPADGILDDTHALTGEAHQKLAAQLANFRQDQGYRVWLVTSTFLDSGKTVRYYSRDLRKAWCGPDDGILLAYDRGTDRSAISLSPGIWNRFSASALTQLLQVGGTIMSDATKTPEQRLTEFTGKLLSGMREINQQHNKINVSFSRDHRRLAIAFASAIAIGALVLFILGIRSRRQDMKNALQSHMPDIMVGTRLGAAFGGGLNATWTDEKKLDASFQ
jgi:hypothetical protein